MIEILKAMLDKGYEYFADTDKGIVFRGKNKEGFIKFNSWSDAREWIAKGENEKQKEDL